MLLKQSWSAVWQAPCSERRSLNVRVMNSLNLSWFTRWALLSNCPYLSQTASHNIALCRVCCLHGDCQLVRPSGGVTSVPVGILAQIHTRTSRETSNKQSNERMCRMGLESVMEVCLAWILSTDACSLFDLLSHVARQHVELKDMAVPFELVHSHGGNQSSLHIPESIWIDQSGLFTGIMRGVWEFSKVSHQNNCWKYPLERVKAYTLFCCLGPWFTPPPSFVKLWTICQLKIKSTYKHYNSFINGISY